MGEPRNFYIDICSDDKGIPALQAQGHEVMAVQYGLDTFTEDVAAIKRTLGRVSSPAILVGHSYGGATITAARTDDRVVGLVYLAAVAPDAGETVQGQGRVGGEAVTRHFRERRAAIC
ncbi:alpha/beta fold hydrolase [Bradyrhizobium sp.]|jgi:pimeloyl-ACP methyl ester carboxylesterase|uniref:alpha/beta fold hydrolase n=1 Tax=Bradyrhizobium sp. TaxID=376 RepID=UPI003C6FEB4B